MVSKFMHFEIGSAVEVSIDDGGSWLSATIVSHVDSNRMLVNCHHLGMRAVVSRHQLRLFSPPASNRELKTGDIVEAFQHGLWWKGCVREDLGDGRLVVSLMEGEEMTLPKKLLRVRQDWINQNRFSTIINNDNNNEDIISNLPDEVLLHIMNFMDTKDAVKTSVLCKRWKSICKQLTNLTFSPSTQVLMEQTDGVFKNFASWVLFSRDHSCSIHNLSIDCWVDPTLLDEVIKYALSCNLQHLRLYDCSLVPSFSLIFCSSSLISLKLCTNFYAILPKSFHLPSLKIMHLEWVRFSSTTDDNISVEPFSNCHVLTTLFLAYCLLPGDAQVLCISNSTLSSLTILAVQDCQITLSTPNLSSFSILGSISHHLLSTCHLSFLQQVNIDQYLDGDWDDKISVIMEWLQVLANLKELTVYPIAFQTILYELSKPISARRQPPRFTRLESLKVYRLSFQYTSQILKALIGYLLQNSPMATVDIITI